MWSLFILVTCINGLIRAWVARRQLQTRPELAPGYGPMLRLYFLWFNIPWLVMGAGCTVGRVPGIFSYLRPRDLDPWVLAFYATLVLQNALGCCLVWWGGWDQFFIRYRDLWGPYQHQLPATAGQVRLLAVLILVGTVVTVAALYFFGDQIG
jgi:heme A synthase